MRYPARNGFDSLQAVYHQLFAQKDQLLNPETNTKSGIKKAKELIERGAPEAMEALENRCRTSGAFEPCADASPFVDSGF